MLPIDRRSVGRYARKVATAAAAANVATVTGNDVASSNDQFTTPLAFHALVSAVADLTLGIGVTEDAGDGSVSYTITTPHTTYSV